MSNLVLLRKSKGFDISFIERTFKLSESLRGLAQLSSQEVQILDETVYISFRVNALGKAMNLRLSSASYR